MRPHSAGPEKRGIAGGAEDAGAALYVGEGGEIMLWIPAELAYGDRNVGADIGPNEALTFKVELVSVKPYVEKPETEE